jgi:hypothetical protein
MVRSLEIMREQKSSLHQRDLGLQCQHAGRKSRPKPLKAGKDGSQTHIRRFLRKLTCRTFQRSDLTSRKLAVLKALWPSSRALEEGLAQRRFGQTGSRRTGERWGVDGPGLTQRRADYPRIRAKASRSCPEVGNFSAMQGLTRGGTAGRRSASRRPRTMKGPVGYSGALPGLTVDGHLPSGKL